MLLPSDSFNQRPKVLRLSENNVDREADSKTVLLYSGIDHLKMSFATSPSSSYP
jgi:hypothetical protein